MRLHPAFLRSWDILQKILQEESWQDFGRQVKDYKKLAAELEIGEITLRDIVKELEKPARDPRDEMPKPILRTDVSGYQGPEGGHGTERNCPQCN